MNLAAKYNRTELIRDGDIQAWHGVERASGEAVVLYLYTGNITGGQALGEVARDALVQSIDASEAAVDGGVFGLSPCVVARKVDVKAAAPTPVKTPEPPQFTAPAPPSAPASAPPPAASSAPAEPAVSSAQNGAPGEFTAMFGAALASEVSPVPAQAAPAPEPLRPEPAAPVSETPRSDATPPAAPVETPHAAAAAPPHPGVFTNLFMAAKSEEVSAPEPAVVAEPAKPAPPPNPGVFTSLYMATSAEAVSEATTPEAAAPEPSPAVAPVSGHAEAMPGETPVDEAVPAAAAPDETHAEGPGEFTMAFGAAAFREESKEATEEAISQDVTQPLPSLESLESATAAPEPSEAVAESFVVAAEGGELDKVEESLPEAAAPGGEEAPGEFTRLFEPAAVEAASSSELLEGTATPEEPSADAAAAADVTPPEKSEDAGAGDGEVERYSSASPAKGPIRFATGEKPAASEAPKPSRSPLSSGSFSQTYVSTGEMLAMREPIADVPSTTPSEPTPGTEGSDAPGEFTMLFASPGGAAGAEAASTESPAATPSSLELPPVAPKEPVPVSTTPPAAAPASAAPQTEGPGEFTRFFQQGDVDKMKEEMAAMSASAAPAAPEAKETPEPKAGEFTQMFTAAEALAKAETPKDPGVFTSLYMAANPDQPEAAAPAVSTPPPVFSAPAPESAGTFTNLFRAAEGGFIPTEPASTPAADFTPPAPTGGLSLPETSSISEEPSFTRYFQADDLAAVPSAPAEPEVVAPSPDLPAYSSGYSKGATSFFQATPEPVAPEPQAPQGPGEYTRMISGAELQQAMEAGGGPAGGGAPSAPGGGGGGVSVNVPLSTPQVSGPYVQGPHVSGPYVSGPQISGSGISAPQIQGPHFSGPQMSGPHVQGPHMSTPQVQVSSVQTPPIQTGGGAPAAPGQQAAAGGGVSKIIIVATVLVTVIAVVLLLLVAYFMLKPTP
ncbi:MAG: hypothetical protein LC114_00195 [Bryobacterales bacterium]|nr:hypothetical protein [Bryobacterales bacterium]